MTSTERPRIALCCATIETQRAWQVSLQDPGYELIESLPAPGTLNATDWGVLLAELKVELICTDAAQIERQLAQRGGRGEAEPLGLIIVDRAAAEESGSGAYEYRPGNLTRVRMPANVPAAQLKLACQLLVDAVRLRRQIEQAGRTQQNLAKQALVDPLTGLPNRRAWDEELARRIAGADAAGGSLALAIFDLDCFKSVNDEQGHDVGDSTLQSAARRLRGALRERDFLARLGGDEFGLLVSGVDAETAERIVERARGTLGAIIADDNCPAPAASAGVAVRAAQSSLNGAQLFQRADQALLEAKRGGRQQTVAARE